MGRLVRPHGLRGELVLLPETDFPERFVPGATFAFVVPGAPPFTGRLAAVRPHGDRILVTVEGTTDATQAEKLRGAELYVSRADVIRKEGWVFGFELEGCTAVDRSGTVLGTVVDLFHVADRPLITLATPAGERDVPFVAPLVVETDMTRRRIVLDLPQGLLD